MDNERCPHSTHERRGESLVYPGKTLTILYPVRKDPTNALTELDEQLLNGVVLSLQHVRHGMRKPHQGIDCLKRHVRLKKVP